MAIDFEQQTMTNTQDISKLTGLVVELATTVKYEAERMKEDRDGVKDMVIQLRGINDKMFSMATTQNEISQIDKEVTEVRTRVDQLKEWKDKYDLSNMRSRLEALETIKSQAEGAEKAISTSADWFWRLFGPIVSVVIIAVFYYAFSPHAHYTQTETYYDGKITGE